jgi:hypothetical protein
MKKNGQKPGSENPKYGKSQNPRPLQKHGVRIERNENFCIEILNNINQYTH